MQYACSSCTRYIAELFGTLVLVLLGVGSAVLAASVIGNLGISLVFGLTVLVLVYTIGPVSGCHINPAISLGMLFLGKLSFKDTLFYIIAQLIGAAIGAWLVYYIASGKLDHTVITTLAANGYDEHSPGKYSMMAVGVTEAVMTALLLLVVFATTTEKFAAGFGGIAIGLALVVIHLVSLPISNTSVNFARSFGSAVIEQGWALHELWLFGVAQLIAVVIAVVLYKIFFCVASRSS
ncbi:aquaporin [Candidatus Paracaedibacter symbiosus]|uniref:aquaporin n=1 Tax=Candidatus Paracaedibacter symbiosus TaxID=244582 RepID=UPI000509FFB9|nr:aquaporin [Candidatus Paracaedibacter symbiosus]